MAYDGTLFSPNNKNFLSPVGFKFIIGRTPNVDYFCQSASIPDVSIGVRDISTPVKDYSVPGDKIVYGDLNLGRSSEFMKTMSDARLLVLNSNYNSIATVNFYNIFPTSLTTLEFDAAATDINYFTAEVNFKYTVYEITDKNQNKV